MNRILYADDCLNVLNDELALPTGSVDLIYLDPPFNSNSHYNLPFKGKDRDARPVEAFNDIWTWEPKDNDTLRELASGLQSKYLADFINLAVTVQSCGEESSCRQALRGFSPWARQVPKREARVILLMLPRSDRVPPLTLRLTTRWRRLRSAALLSDGASGSAMKTKSSLIWRSMRRHSLAWVAEGS